MLQSDMERVQETLDNLPANCKKAFILVRYEGLSAQQAAKQMKLSPWRVRRFVQRAFAACQKALHPETS